MSHCLGSGSFAQVHLAMDTSAFKQVACKCIRRKSSDKIEKIRKEVDILLNLTHVSWVFISCEFPLMALRSQTSIPFVQQRMTINFCALSSCPRRTFLVLTAYSYIFLELCTGGDLFSYIVSHQDSKLSQAEAKYLMYQLLKGLKYLHDRLISHRGAMPNFDGPNAFKLIQRCRPEGVQPAPRNHASLIEAS